MYDKFEKLCKSKGVTPYRVAQETKVSTATLSNWKKGTYTPKTEKLQILADYFDVPLSFFFCANITKNWLYFNISSIDSFNHLKRAQSAHVFCYSISSFHKFHIYQNPD